MTSIGFGNRTQSNSPKNLANRTQSDERSEIEHNRTIEHCIQQSKVKPVSSGLNKALHSNNLCIGFNFKHEYAKMSQGENAENVKYTILEAMVKGYYECSFAVGVGEKFLIKK